MLIVGLGLMIGYVGCASQSEGDSGAPVKTVSQEPAFLKLNDDVAKAMTDLFYTALGKGSSLVDAYKDATNQIEQYFPKEQNVCTTFGNKQDDSVTVTHGRALPGLRKLSKTTVHKIDRPLYSNMGHDSPENRGIVS